MEKYEIQFVALLSNMSTNCTYKSIFLSKIQRSTSLNLRKKSIAIPADRDTNSILKATQPLANSSATRAGPAQAQAACGLSRVAAAAAADGAHPQASSTEAVPAFALHFAASAV